MSSSASSYLGGTKKNSSNQSRGPRPSDPLRPSLSSVYDLDLDDEEYINMRASASGGVKAITAPPSAENPMYRDSEIDDIEFSSVSAKAINPEKKGNSFR